MVPSQVDIGDWGLGIGYWVLDIGELVGVVGVTVIFTVGEDEGIAVGTGAVVMRVIVVVIVIAIADEGEDKGVVVAAGVLVTDAVAVLDGASARAVGMVVAGSLTRTLGLGVETCSPQPATNNKTRIKQWKTQYLIPNIQYLVPNFLTPIHQTQTASAQGHGGCIIAARL
jgi:hypothetical protein